MSFEVSADAYASFMGRFSVPLATLFADAVGVSTGQSALDVGCGTGALTHVLVERLGPERMCAVDPSPSFVEVMRERFPTIDVRTAHAESLPFETARFDLVLAQLVVHFMNDPVRGIGEMARVTRPGGVVGANVWDHAGGAGPLAVFWSAVRSIDPRAPDESHLPGVREGHLSALFAQAGLTLSASTALTLELEHASFDTWWHPFTLGVGPAGTYVAALNDTAREDLRERCRAMLPEGPFTTRATAWAVWATVPAGSADRVGG
jgi:SAM-dependent methyltransferase